MLPPTWLIRRILRQIFIQLFLVPFGCNVLKFKRSCSFSWNSYFLPVDWISAKWTYGQAGMLFEAALTNHMLLHANHHRLPVFQIELFHTDHTVLISSRTFQFLIYFIPCKICHLESLIYGIKFLLKTSHFGILQWTLLSYFSLFDWFLVFLCLSNTTWLTNIDLHIWFLGNFPAAVKTIVLHKDEDITSLFFSWAFAG